MKLKQKQVEEQGQGQPRKARSEVGTGGASTRGPKVLGDQGKKSEEDQEKVKSGEETAVSEVGEQLANLLEQS